MIVSVHVDGFRAGPAAYLTATKWWILGKRVRARGQFAPLLSRAPRAYTLWSRRETLRYSDRLKDCRQPPIVALVATGPALADTLQSLTAEGVPAFLVGDNHIDGIMAAAVAIDWTAAPWVLPMRAGERLAPGAVAAYQSAMRATEAAVIYADDDRLDRWGRRTTPHFKPDWNSELFRHFDYLTGACIVRANQADVVAVAGQPDWDVRLITAAIGQGNVDHLRRMLHHRPTRHQPIAAARLATATNLPLVTVIIPTRNRLDLLRTCLAGVANTHYPEIEVIVVDNDSDDVETLDYLAALDPARARVMRYAGPFNYSAINNRAVGKARGKLLCLLNNDIEMLAPDWLAIMATQALREDVGAVGAQLLYPDGRIQHAGVVVGVGNAAGHAHRFLRPEEQGYFRRHALPQFTAAVTAACLVVRRDRFLVVGGLDEQNFPVAFNDVDLCLRLNQRGWQSLYEPRAVLIHHESVSRGNDSDPAGAARFAGELAALKRIWKTDEIVDPFHHPHLSRAAEQFCVAI